MSQASVPAGNAISWQANSVLHRVPCFLQVRVAITQLTITKPFAHCCSCKQNAPDMLRLQASGNLVGCQCTTQCLVPHPNSKCVSACRTYIQPPHQNSNLTVSRLAFRIGKSSSHATGRRKLVVSSSKGFGATKKVPVKSEGCPCGSNKYYKVGDSSCGWGM